MSGFQLILMALALAASGCGALGGIEEHAPALDTAATRAQQTGGCLKIRCEYLPVRCRPAAARCERGW